MIKKDLNKDYDYRGKVEYLDRANIKNTKSGLFKFEFQEKKGGCVNKQMLTWS